MENVRGILSLKLMGSLYFSQNIEDLETKSNNPNL